MVKVIGHFVHLFSMFIGSSRKLFKMTYATAKVPSDGHEQLAPPYVQAFWSAAKDGAGSPQRYPSAPRLHGGRAPSAWRQGGISGCPASQTQP